MRELTLHESIAISGGALVSAPVPVSVHAPDKTTAAHDILHDIFPWATASIAAYFTAKQFADLTVTLLAGHTNAATADALSLLGGGAAGLVAFGVGHAAGQAMNFLLK